MNGNLDRRRGRLDKIKRAQLDVESAIYTLEAHVPSTKNWTNKTWTNLYYILRLARLAPLAKEKRHGTTDR